MTPDAPDYLLDTNVVLLLARNGKEGKRIDALYSLSSRPFRPLISIVFEHNTAVKRRSMVLFVVLTIVGMYGVSLIARDQKRFRNS